MEKEQESLVNRLWKRMEKLETDKKLLLSKLQQPPHLFNTTSDPSSSVDLRGHERLNVRSYSLFESNTHLNYADELKREVEKLQAELNIQKETYQTKVAKLIVEEQNAKTENLRLQRKLQVEVDRRQQLYKQLSESESSLEMDEERAFESNNKIKFNSTIIKNKFIIIFITIEFSSIENGIKSRIFNLSEY